MNSYTFHISLHDLSCIGTIFIGLNFALQLWFTKNVNRPANRFLALALGVMVLSMAGLLGMWTILAPFSLAFGPLLYFYARKATQPERRFGWKDLLHFCPGILGQAIWISGIALQVKPIAFMSIGIYLYLSHRLIEQFYSGVKFSEGDRHRREWQWLDHLLAGLGFALSLWIPLTVIDYFVFHFTLNSQAYYPLSLLMAIMIIRMGAVAFFRMGTDAFIESDLSRSFGTKSAPSTALKQKGSWLKKEIETGLLYQDAELNISSLAKHLNITAHELSRIINVVFKKNFNDFINECRIREVVRKMQDPAYDRFTLLGIAYESGFNSKSTFNRTFKELTGLSPVEYKNNLKKERPFSNLRPLYGNRQIVLHHQTTFKWSHEKLNRIAMFRNYLKIAWRNLVKNKVSSFINIGGLATGMAVAMLIGFWVYDEVSFDKVHENYNRIAQVMMNGPNNGSYITQKQLPIPIASILKSKFANDFKNVVLSTQTRNFIVSYGDKKFTEGGNFIEPQGPAMLTLKMIQGTRNGLKDPHSILISQSLAKTIFNNADALGQTIHMNDTLLVKVTGVYEDLPYNSTFKDVEFFAPWDLAVYADKETANHLNSWDDNNWQIFIQLAENADAATISKKISNVVAVNSSYVKPTDKMKPKLFLFPMSSWHLYSEFKNGVNVGGRIQYVRLFWLIGIFVLLLACINFMNLSTARSEKRAKEVGIRKAIGSLRAQLIAQFYIESLIVAFIAFGLALLLVLLVLPAFNTLADKQISIPWSNPLLWITGIGFSLFTGLIAGSYPALYLSSFEPIKVLKGVFKTGKFASLPRKVLVVTQFTVSIALIIGTIIVFEQIQYARDRPVGYDRYGLITMETHNNDIYTHFDAFRDDLLKTGAIVDVAQSTGPVTEMRNQQDNFNWSGKDPANDIGFATEGVSPGYAKTIGLKFMQGRDFRTGPQGFDALTMVLSESAAKYMGFKHPVGETIEWVGFKFTIIGVVKDMVMDSPYAEVYPTIFYIAPFKMRVLNIRINPKLSAKDALAKITPIFTKYNPDEPFDYKFTDQEYDTKFRAEQRIGSLASFFASLAVFISCLGLFGLASFVAEQRTKEIGVRKVLGATVFNLWQMLSKDFIVLILISCFIAIPLAWYYLHQWLQQYVYHTEISWWIFGVTILGSLVITLITVSFQAIKAALANPVKSLRSE